MTKLRENLESLTALCWSTTNEDEIEQKVKIYTKAYPHLHNPASMDLLRECMKLWIRIQKVEQRLDQEENSKEFRLLNVQLDKLTRTWLAMLSSLGLGFTKQQYISKKKGGQAQPPVEELKELMRKQKGVK